MARDAGRLHVDEAIVLLSRVVLGEASVMSVMRNRPGEYVKNTGPATATIVIDEKFGETKPTKEMEMAVAERCAEWWLNRLDELRR